MRTHLLFQKYAIIHVLWAVPPTSNSIDIIRRYDQASCRCAHGGWAPDVADSSNYDSTRTDGNKGLKVAVDEVRTSDIEFHMMNKSESENPRGQCPVDHRSSSKAHLATTTPSGDNRKLGSEQAAQQEISSPSQKGNEHPVFPSASAEASKCPVDHKNMSKEELAGFMSRHKNILRESDADLTNNIVAKVHGNGEDTGLNSSQIPLQNQIPAYDVYGQEINPANMMPATPNQLPSPGQASRLSTERVSSSIPKSETGGGTWTYPSPQMFYNALKRKGKADDVNEGDIDSVVAIHNSMNERTWGEILRWERQFHCEQCSEPKLRKFCGKPNELSPSARFRTIFRGYPAPFDRHDWVVDRCGNEDARYIIDYYHRESDRRGDDPIEIHVRPALDSPGAVWDRIRYRVGTIRESLFPGPVQREARGPEAFVTDKTSQEDLSRHFKSLSGEILGDEEFEFLRTLTAEKLRSISDEMQRDCGKFGELLGECGNDKEKCEQANVALNYCMAGKICKPQAKAFMDSMEAASGSETAAYGNMAACLERFHIMARRVLMHAAGVTQDGPER